MAKQHPPRKPLPDNYIPPGGRKCEVYSGQSLATIARDNGISEDALNSFNFGTTIPEEINWYLDHRVHCKTQTPDHLNWMFTTESPRLFIYLPPLPPGAKPPAPPAPASGIGPAAKPALQPVPATVAGPDTELKWEIQLPERKIPVPPTSPVLVSISGKITAKGTVRVDGSHSKISAALNKPKVDIELKFQDKLGDFKFKGGLEPGKLSKLGLEWTTQNIPISIEFAANANLAKLISVSGKWKNPIPLANFPLSEHETFIGTIEPQLDFNFSPNPAWPGWRAAAQAAAQGTRAAFQAGANAVRGIFIAEEAGTLTAVGTACVAVAIAAAIVGWVIFGFYELDQGHRSGRALSIKYGFAGGYASALADLTSDSPSMNRAEVARLLEIDWEESLKLFVNVYVNESSPGVTVSSDDLKTLGKAAVVQWVDDYLQKNGLPAWNAIRKKHQQRYGANYMQRRDNYSRILMLQIQSGRDPIGISILE